MSVLDQDLSMYESEDKELVFTHSGSDASTASEIKFCLSNKPTTAAWVTKTLGSGVVADSSTQYTVTLDAADTTDKGGRSYYFECRMTDSGGSEGIVAAGYLDMKVSNSE